jgi:hypothetical protein
VTDPHDHHVRVQDGLVVGVRHQPLDAPMARLHEPQHGLLVVGPLLGEGGGRGELATAQLESDLEAIRVDVVEVLHAPSDLVPEGPVRDPLVEVVVLARLAFPHQRVGLGVGEGEFLEQVVVGGPALAAALSLRAAIVPVKVTARGKHNILLGVVVRVAGDDGAPVEVSGEDERPGDDPGHKGDGLGLASRQYRSWKRRD